MVDHALDRTMDPQTGIAAFERLLADRASPTSSSPGAVRVQSQVQSWFSPR